MLDTQTLLDYGGMLIVFLVVYGQTGLLFLFMIPSGAFMFAAGAMIASGAMGYNILTAGGLLLIAAIAGNLTGYFVGQKAGSILFKKEDSRFFKKEYLQRASDFYGKYGGKALALGLFLPIVRTFAPIVAGIVKMDIKRFLFFTSIGSVGWIYSFMLAGYIVGSRPYFKPYLNYIVIGIIVVVTIPIVIRIVREFSKKKEQNTA